MKNGKDFKEKFKKFLRIFLISILGAFFVMFLSEIGAIPWHKIVKPVYRIPDLKGIEEQSAEIVCRVMGLSMKVMDEVYSKEYPTGVVISQEPLALSRTRNPEVGVIVCKGQAVIQVPELKGISLQEASTKLKELSLIAGQTKYVSSKVEKGKIVYSEPPAGSKVNYEDTINVFISKGQDLITVPNIIGKSLSGAQKILADNGLILGYVKKTTDIDKRFGIILKQHPPSKRKVPKGTSITVVVNEEEE